MLELPNFGHMITSTMQFDSLDKILLVTSWTEVKCYNFYFKIILFQEGLEQPFCWHHQNCSHAYENNLQGLKKR